MTPLVLILFTFTGFCGLVYEVLWTRMLALVLGSTTAAAATVLGTYMGGLALGSWWFGRIAARPGASGLRIFGWLELGAGLYAFALTSVVAASHVIFVAVWPLVAGSAPGQGSLRVALAVLTLLPPAILMGGSLPALSQEFVRTHARAGASIGTLYAVNTAGAVLGCFLCGFVFMEAFGVRRTLWGAGAINVLVALVALGLARRRPAEARPDPNPVQPLRASPSSSTAPLRVRIALIAFGVAGCVGLALEVLWTRALLFFVNIDTWAFTAMLTAFLAGIALGSAVMSRFVDRLGDPLRAFGIVQVLLGLTTAASLPLLGVLYESFGALADARSVVSTPLAQQVYHKLGQSFLVMIGPTLLMGASFPLVSRVFVGARGDVGRSVGVLYAVNTIGAIVGALGAGFVLIPWLGVHAGILLAASIYVVSGLVVWTASLETIPGRRRARWTLAGVAAALVTVNLAFDGGALIRDSYWFKREGYAGRFEVLFYEEAPDATVTVLEKDIGTRELNINGQSTAFDNYRDMQVHRMLSHLPMLLHPDPQTCLVVGFGMGSTVYGTNLHRPATLEVVELLATERRTAVFFEHVNHGVLSDPGVKFVVGDGRNHLLATRQRYDVISFNAIHPRYSASLYTREFYELCRERMAPGGIVCAWMTQNSMTHGEWLMLCRSMTGAFPHAALWFSNAEHYCLLASDRPMRIDLDRWRDRVRGKVAEDLAESNLDDPLWLASRFLFEDDELRAYLGAGDVNSDDRPLIEFAREIRPEEGRVVAALIERKRPVTEILVDGTSDADRAQLGDYDVAMRAYMSGEAEFWYPSEPLLDRVWLRRAFDRLPDGQDVRESLECSRGYRTRMEAQRVASPDAVGPRLALAWAALHDGELGAARDLLEDTQRRHPRDMFTVAYLGLTQFLAGDFAAARASLPPAIDALGRAPNPSPDIARLQAFCAFALEGGLGALGDQDAGVSALCAQIQQTLPRARELFGLLQSNVRVAARR